MRVVGIDPGAEGGIAYIDHPDSDITVHKMPENESERCKLFRAILSEPDMVVVMEKVGGYVGGGEICPVCFQPKNQSPGSSMFNFGRNAGVTIGCLLALGVQYQETEPQRWQSVLGLKRPSGMDRQEWKRELKRTAQRWYPSIKVTLAIADAMLLARYAQLQVIGYPEAEPLE